MAWSAPTRIAVALTGAATVALSITVGVALAFPSDDAPAASAGPYPGDHWHTALGVQICGTWMPNVRAFHYSDGLASLGDGLAHIKPVAGAPTQPFTLGRFLRGAAIATSAHSLHAFGHSLADGDRCPNGARGELTWWVDGVLQPGDPAGHVLADGQVVVIAFDPVGDPYPGQPPQADQFAAKAAVDGGPQPTIAPGTTAGAPDSTTSEPFAPPTSAPGVTDQPGPSEPTPLDPTPTIPDPNPVAPHAPAPPAP